MTERWPVKGDMVKLWHSPERYIVAAIEPDGRHVTLLPIPPRNEWAFDPGSFRRVETASVRIVSALPMLPCDWPAVMQERLQAEA
jgi:hypothetical protein